MNHAWLTQFPLPPSDIIAGCAGVQHHAVQQLITRYEDDIKEFGVIAFEMRKLPQGSQGGRPETVYHLNEDQATLLVTYLQNTGQVRQFKNNLVRQFSTMKKQLQEWRYTRDKSKAAHKSLTDAVRDSSGSKWDYKHLTDLAYKKVTGMGAAKLKASRGASKTDTAKDFLTPDELTALEKLDNLMAALVDAGMDYHGIKATLLQADVLQVAS